MWIASKNGFYSIVKHDSIPDRWLIRVRDIQDLVSQFGKKRVIVTHDSDYIARVIVTKEELTDFLLKQGDIDYTNFKNYIRDSKQHTKLTEYHAIWMEMYMYQNMKYDRDYNTYYNRFSNLKPILNER